MLLLTARTALGSVVTSDMTRRAARLALYRAGFTYLSGGSFASVWLAPDGERVVKVTKPDPGMEATYEASSALPDSPHLSRFYGRLALANGGFAYEVEALHPADEDAYNDFEDSEEWRILEWNPAGDPRTHYATPIAEALGALAGAKRKGPCHLGWDMHDGNVMERDDGTLVLTDLIYAPSHLSDSANNTYNSNRNGTAHRLTDVVTDAELEAA